MCGENQSLANPKIHVPLIGHFLDAVSRVFLATRYYPRKYTRGKPPDTRKNGRPEACPITFGRPSFGVGETPERDTACDCKVDLHENFIHPTRDQSYFLH